MRFVDVGELRLVHDAGYFDWPDDTIVIIILLNRSFSDSLSFSPGLTGGVLMVALVLSAIGKTGPIIWSMSGPANQLLRQLGLLLFLSEVGTSAGENLRCV